MILNIVGVYLFMCAVFAFPLWGFLILDETCPTLKPSNLYELIWIVSLGIGSVIWSPVYLCMFLIVKLGDFMSAIKIGKGKE